MISRILFVLLTWPATSAGKQLGRLLVPLTRRYAGLIWPLLPILNFPNGGGAVRPRTSSSIIHENEGLGKGCIPAGRSTLSDREPPPNAEPQKDCERQVYPY